ncbi:kinase-like domain-containing protein [Auriculariales sp. MPI-PUGE-AT-0066]|nr:kinase-like domain-containing protein [Auriculariales sp. MPI-PUGE-AT-0066]
MPKASSKKGDRSIPYATALPSTMRIKVAPQPQFTPILAPELGLVERYAPNFFELSTATELGKGGEGVVFVVRCKRSRSNVALKVYHGGMYHGGVAESTILQELKDANAPNVVHLAQSFLFEDVQQAFIATEYYRSGDLWNWARKNEELIYSAHGPEIIMSFMRDIVHAIPENVLLKHVDGKLRLYLADFGTAWCATRDLAADGRVHAEWSPNMPLPLLPKDRMTGTVTYCPPETFKDEIRGAGNDVWAAALSIIWIFDTDHQFDRGAPDDEIEDAVLNDLVELPEPLYENEYPESFRELLFGCLDKDPRKRYTAADLRLHKFCESIPWRCPAFTTFAEPALSSPIPTFSLSPTSQLAGLFQFPDVCLSDSASSSSSSDLEPEAGLFIMPRPGPACASASLDLYSSIEFPSLSPIAFPRADLFLFSSALDALYDPESPGLMLDETAMR